MSEVILTENLFAMLKLDYMAIGIAFGVILHYFLVKWRNKKRDEK